MGNLDTMIFAPLRSIIQGPDGREAERLRERLGAATLLIGLARGAVIEGRLAEAEKYLDLAEKSARAERRDRI